MSSALSRASAYLQRLGFMGLLLIAPLARATPPVSLVNDSPHVAPTQATAMPHELIRYGRYALVEVGPTSAQRDLMTQLIDVTMPPVHEATIGDALRYVLQRSGYQLDATPEATVLYSRPLPAADDRLGPMTLRDALLVLAGPAWQLHTNEVARRIWFTPSSNLPELTSAATITATPSATAVTEAKP